MSKITVKDKQITVLKVNDEDYLSLTDMLKAKDGDFFRTDWLRNRNTLEYIGIWEQVSILILWKLLLQKKWMQFLI